jgi:hypothetical protein
MKAWDFDYIIILYIVMTLTKRKYNKKKIKKRFNRIKRLNKSKRFNRTKRRNKSKRVRKSKKGGGKESSIKRRNLKLPPLYQLFTDADDTLHPSGFASLGYLNIAGVDNVGNRHKFYDCVSQLHQQIQARNGGLPTIIISANPLPATSSKKKKIKKALGIEQLEIFSGSALSSGSSILQNVRIKVGEFVAPLKNGQVTTDTENLHFQAMADVKVDQITKYVSEMRKEQGKKGRRYRPIWIGDNGQGDLLAAKILLQNKVIFAALIHWVDPRKASGKSSIWYRYENPPRLFPFKNYGEAIEHLKHYAGLQDLTSCHIEQESLHHLLRQKSFDASNL